jgi:RNA polymerase sigma-70 factor (ECF subfamily)
VSLNDDHIFQLNKGDIKTFHTIYENMYHSLCLYGFKIINDEDIVKDVVQEAFIVLWNRRVEFNKLIGTKAYLYSTVRNQLLNLIRDKKTVPIEDVNVNETTFDNQITQEETYKLLREAIDELPEQTKNILNLAINGCLNDEIAEQLNISVNTVKTLKRKGYAKLREMLKDNIYLLIPLAEFLNI